MPQPQFKPHAGQGSGLAGTQLSDVIGCGARGNNIPPLMTRCRVVVFL